MNDTFVFKDPFWFVALLFVLGAVALRRLRPQRVWVVPFAARWNATRRSDGLDAMALGAGLIGVSLLIAALARPQLRSERTEFGFEAYDVMLAIDVSRSMLSEDYERDGRKVNRLEALKPIVEKFVAERPRDRIGMVVFSGRAYTLMPPTWNHARLLWLFERLEIARFPEGTAIGDGLMLALHNLADVRPAVTGVTRPAFVVLMSDGTSNAGLFSVSEGVEQARRQGTRVYTIAAGTGEVDEIPYWDEQGKKHYEDQRAEVDEGALWSVAEATGGEFFRATHVGAIHASFAAIGARQNLSVPLRKVLRAREVFVWFAAPGLAFLLLAAGLLRLSPARWERFAAGVLTITKELCVAIFPATRPIWLRHTVRTSRVAAMHRS